ncbi:hypothetical protein [Stenotrophomonas rhizophila]|uniref:hypothetical protein n=1 Tax=Stenotrophomonas rhizophila TaxID=216778 RepID=UPI0011A1950B|nr:hypothetical protein [Stenotrophomonas rhizophila]
MKELINVVMMLPFGLILLCLPFNVLMLQRMRRDHPLLFEAFGEPRTFGPGGAHWGNSDYTRFLLLRTHHDTLDSGLLRLRDIQWVLLLASVASLVVFVLLAVAGQQ